MLSTLHSVVSHSQPHVSQLLDFNMLSTLWPVVSSHMQVSYTLDFNMMSTLHSVVSHSQPHVSQLVSYTLDFNMMSTLSSVVSQPHVLQTGFQHAVNPVPCGVTATCDLVTNWILTCCHPCALWCHNHMCYKLDFNMLSTLCPVVSQPHVTNWILTSCQPQRLPSRRSNSVTRHM